MNASIVLAMQACGLPDLIQGQKVSFEIEPDTRGNGSKAVELANVKRCSKPLPRRQVFLASCYRYRLQHSSEPVEPNYRRMPWTPKETSGSRTAPTKSGRMKAVPKAGSRSTGSELAETAMPTMLRVPIVERRQNPRQPEEVFHPDYSRGARTPVAVQEQMRDPSAKVEEARLAVHQDQRLARVAEASENQHRRHGRQPAGCRPSSRRIRTSAPAFSALRPSPSLN